MPDRTAAPALLGLGAGAAGLELTTRTPAPGHPGCYLVAPGGPVALPLDERLRIAPAGAPGAPPVRLTPPVDRAPGLVATRATWLAGVRCCTVEYAMWRRE